MNSVFIPYESVLVGSTLLDSWKINFYSHLEKEGNYVCMTGVFKYCIPYKNNELLLGIPIIDSINKVHR